MKASLLMISILTSLFSASFAFAMGEDVNESNQVHGACKSDVKKFCKGVVPGQGRIAACLQSHESNLNPECKSSGEHVKGRWSEAIKKRRDEARAAAKGTAETSPQ